MSCVVAATSSAVCQMQHRSAQMLLLAHSFELHPLTTLSPVLQPWKLSHHTRSSKDTGYNTQSIFAATSVYSIQQLCSLFKTENPYQHYCGTTQTISSCQRLLCFTNSQTQACIYNFVLETHGIRPVMVLISLLTQWLLGRAKGGQPTFKGVIFFKMWTGC